MIGKALAAYLGEKIDQRDGKGGALGALAGVAVYGLAKRAVPAAILLGGVALGVRYLRKRSATA